MPLGQRPLGLLSTAILEKKQKFTIGTQIHTRQRRCFRKEHTRTSKTAKEKARPSRSRGRHLFCSRFRSLQRTQNPRANSSHPPLDSRETDSRSARNLSRNTMRNGESSSWVSIGLGNWIRGTGERWRITVWGSEGARRGKGICGDW